MKKHIAAALAGTIALFGCCVPPNIVPPAPESRPAVEVKSSGPKIRAYTFHVDDALSPFGFRILQRAFAVWERYTNGLVYFDLRHDLTDDNALSIAHHEPAVVLVHSTTDVIANYDASVPCSECTLALTLQHETHPTILLVMDRLTDPRDFYETAIHEIGHAIGIPHIPTTDAVMFPTRGVLAATCPTKADMAAFCEVAACNLRDVRWCD